MWGLRPRPACDLTCGEWGRPRSWPDGATGNSPNPRLHLPGNLMAQFYFRHAHLTHISCHLPTLTPTSLRPRHLSELSPEGCLPCGPPNLLAEHSLGMGGFITRATGLREGVFRSNHCPMPHTKSGRWYLPSVLPETCCFLEQPV